MCVCVCVPLDPTFCHRIDCNDNDNKLLINKMYYNNAQRNVTWKKLESCSKEEVKNMSTALCNLCNLCTLCMWKNKARQDAIFPRWFIVEDVNTSLVIGWNFWISELLNFSIFLFFYFSKAHLVDFALIVDKLSWRKSVGSSFFWGNFRTITGRQRGLSVLPNGCFRGAWAVLRRLGFCSK